MRRIHRIVLIGLVLCAGLIGAFFLRRLYYRMIQPAPPWTIKTSHDERVTTVDWLSIDLWADETLVKNPTSISIDPRGRIWVTEAVNYRNWVNHNSESGNAYRPKGDQIVILEDTDHDGRADSRKVFAQDAELVSPTGICVAGNRVYVSCSPHIFVFADENADDVADSKTRLLTGFGGADHDHGVHSLVSGPDGRFYFTVGNAGPHVVTDASGWTLRSGSFYQGSGAGSDVNTTAKLNSGGLVSDDGRVWVGGLVLSVRPDGSDLRVHSHNSRNPYEVAIDSAGDLWQTDNDDTSACRITWLMNGCNTGFASADGRRSWQADQRSGQSFDSAQWHQLDPGVIPAGLIYGTGAPTGLLKVESSRLNQQLDGTILACDAGQGCLFAFRPIEDQAGYRFEQTRLVWSEANSSPAGARPDGLASTWFRPTDVAAGPDGEIYISDWYDSYVGAHRVNDVDAAGRIYVVRSRESRDATPTYSPDKAINREIELLCSDVPAIRWSARDALIQRDSAAINDLRRTIDAPDTSMTLRARIIWVLVELGAPGRQVVSELMASKDPHLRVCALRALVRSGIPVHQLVEPLLDDSSSMVVREAILSLRDAATPEADDLLLRSVRRVDCRDRTMLDALGLAFERRENRLYPRLRLEIGGPAESWSQQFALLIWRLHPANALDDLRLRLRAPGLSASERELTIETIAFTRTPIALEALQEFATVAESKMPTNLASTSQDKQTLSAPAATEDWRRLSEHVNLWISRLKEQPTLEDPALASSSESVLLSVPVHFQPQPTVSVDSELINSIADRAGNVARGAELFYSDKTNCSRCHRVGGRGGDIGPDLSHIPRRLNRQQIAESIVYPSRSILLGYELWSAIRKDGTTESGLLLSLGDNLVLRKANGPKVPIPLTEIEELTRSGASLMPDRLSDVLSASELSDIVEFLTREK